MKKYRIIGKTNSYIARRDSLFNGREYVFLADQLTLKEAQKKLLDMYNEDNNTSFTNWGLAVNHNKGAYATRQDGTRCYEYDSRIYEIEELTYKLSDYLKNEISQSADVEVYNYTGKHHSIHTDYIMDVDIDVTDYYIANPDEIDYELMDESEYNNTVMANTSDVDFEDFYGDKNDKVLVIVLKNHVR